MRNCAFYVGSRSKRSIGALLALAAVLAGTLAGACKPIEPEAIDSPRFPSCDRFDISHWKEFDFGLQSSRDEIVADLTRLYEIDQSQVQVKAAQESAVESLHWTYENASHVARVSRDGILEDIEVHWDGEGPSLDQITECLGQPRIRDETYETGTYETETIRHWFDVEFGESPYPRNIKLLIILAASTASSNSSRQVAQQTLHVTRLTIVAMNVPQQVIENPGPFPCANFAISRLQELRLGVDSLEEVLATVARLWAIGTNELDIVESYEGNFHVITWKEAAAGSIYKAVVAKGAQLEDLKVRFFPVPPTLGQVLQCFGPPDYYFAFGGPHNMGTEMEIWYVESGLVFTGIVVHSEIASIWQEPLQTIPTGFGMSSLYILKPGTEEMARSLNYLDKEGNPTLCKLKPWPESMKAVEIDVTTHHIYPHPSLCEEAMQ